MNDSRIALKVGIFVVVGTALLALLILNFTKGNTLGRATYKLRVILPNAAGLKPAADVMMAGVPIGKVSDMDLADNAKSVNITINILSRYKILTNAQFHIDALGFLGDQYVAVSAPAETDLSPTNDSAYLHSGDTVMGEPTFNMVEAVQSISGVVDEAKKTMQDLDQAITNVNASALSTNTLAHFVLAVGKLDTLSDKAVDAAGRVEDLLSNNAAPFSFAVSNFLDLSARLTNTAAELDQLFATNQADIRKMVTNLTVTSEQFKQMALDLAAGKGPAGSLLKNEKINAQLAAIVSNANALTAEFSIFGSNLNQRGIWAMLWKPKPREKEKEKEKEPPLVRGMQRQ
jgi:phospholipid/cholesterol/gamma-HCH transport system substrate-binding protein